MCSRPLPARSAAQAQFRNKATAQLAEYATSSAAVLQAMRATSSEIVEVDGDGEAEEVGLALAGALEALVTGVADGLSSATDVLSGPPAAPSQARAGSGGPESDSDSSEVGLALENFENGGAPRVDGEGDDGSASE